MTFLDFVACSGLGLLFALAVETIAERWNRRQFQQSRRARPRTCPLCGFDAVMTEHGYQVHLDFCGRRLT